MPWKPRNLRPCLWMAADWTPLTDALRALLSEHGLPESHPVAVAVSGGADSMALLHAACAVSSQVTVLHVDHGLREASNADRQFVEAAAASLGCRFQAHVVEGLEDRAKTTGLGLEAAAREARYGWFAEVLGEGDVLLTGHHADDQRETRLLHLIRGARPDAWRGMDAWTTERGYTVGRPFLGLSRSALIAVLNGAGVAWREDPSNADPRHLRNRLRHDLIPLLDNIRPGWDAGLGRAAELAAEWRDSALTLLETIPHDVLPLAALDTAPSPRHLMSIWSARHGATAGQLDALMELAAPETETGKRCDTPTHGLVRERDGLVARRLASPAQGPLVFDPQSEPEGERPTPGGCVRWTVDRASTRPEILAGEEMAQVSLGALEGPLTLRRWRAGDRLAPLGMDGHQSVADILTQRKVANGDRPSALLLEDALGTAVWLVGHRIDRRAALPTAWPKDGLEVLTLRWVAE
jgi:tRNA(Ile)-lysidine synthase